MDHGDLVCPVLPKYASLTDDSDDRFDCGYRRWIYWSDSWFPSCYLGTSEVIITIMMNYIVLYGGNALIHSFPASLMKNKDSTIDVGANAVYQTEWLRNLTDKSQMNIGIFLAIIAVVVIWFLMKKTTLGFEIRAVGLNANAGRIRRDVCKTDHYPFYDHFWCSCWYRWSSRRSGYLLKCLCSN